jgi:hypothetical protein
MRTNPVPRRNKTAKALLSIYDAKEILRKDQELFHKTLSDLKNRLNFISKKKEDDISSSNGQKVF